MTLLDKNKGTKKKHWWMLLMSWHILTNFYDSTLNMAVCTPDRLNDGETGLIPDDMLNNEWNVRLDKEEEKLFYCQQTAMLTKSCI
jgi:hypothetical protein